ncbi:hypothetical protein NR798_44150 [Archangium gephyra]|uniref:hypothetical protein n=1 Tax=Archangium gephyra TaxID=48 RepID=UPI0035D4D03F
MSHASKLLLLSCLACAFTACGVPSIEDLEAKDPDGYGCNSDHACPTGSFCIEDRCIRTEDLACVPGTRVPCGADKGECRPGTQLCNAEGILGACVDAVTPVFEKCDGKDNDCNGSEDTWAAPVALTLNHELGTPAAAIAVRRAPDGTQDTLLTLMAENGSIVASTLAPDGTWKVGKKLSHPFMSFKLPALAAQGDTVAAAWLGVKYPVGTEPIVYTVYLAMLDGSGAPTNEQVLDIPHGSTGVEPDQIKLAINNTHVLVLIKTPGESVLVTVSRSLDAASRKGPVRLGSVHSGRWFHAMPGGARDRFLVAYEDTYTNPTNGFVTYHNRAVTVSNDGVLGTPILINKSTLTHSPFIVPVPGDASGYSVYYVENGYDTASPRKSLVAFTRCGASTCDAPQAFATFENEVVRMQLAVPPGAAKPEMALFRWQNERLDPPLLTAVTFADKAEWRNELRPPGQPTLSESLVVMPDSTRYLLYNQWPPPPSSVASPAVGYAVTEAYVLPFCSP